MHPSQSGHRPVALIPGAPLLVPELVGAPGDPDADRVRAAVLAAGAWLGARARTWRVVASAPVTRGDAASAGTFAGFGADVIVTTGPGAPSNDLPPSPTWPLPLLLAAWLRGRAAPSARIVDDGDAEGVLFVLDGPNTLTARAPGGHRPEDEAVFDAQVAAVRAGGPIDGLDEGWRAAAAACAGGPVDVLYRDAPFGVGYLVATGGAG
ncbi:hypothetical protein [Tsukamurella ocularis]|uniref:hypothetical protein n=1 Tax=Tsukamurella ocularis TaxID=1970234 RepID=UPI002167241B|nr:hypothetical protein [Tsukamurella ocularis]MCS3780135.1 hypothetical protein [Tsukamurella ocularis]MCS3786311.1 hypothetical protein [Tsukamurella ocularis]MCS3849675.1 hypothetical protein [Tsukamurella ocularis]